MWILFLLPPFSFFLLFPPVSGGTCLVGALTGESGPDGKCYVEVTSDAATWSDARSVCKSWHSAAELPILHDLMDAMFLYDVVYTLSEFDSEIWLGAFDFLDEGVWEWVDGSEVELEIANWFGFDPPVESSKDCGVLLESGLWHHLHCSDLRQFFCVVDLADVDGVVGGSLNPEKNVRFDIESTPVFRFCDIDQVLCPSDAEFWCTGIVDEREGCSYRGNCTFNMITRLPACSCEFGFTGVNCSFSRCEVLGIPGIVSNDGECIVKLTGMSMPWTLARSSCKAWHSAADLPIVSSSSSLTALKQLALLSDGDQVDEVWVGAFDVITPGMWQWVDGSDFSSDFWDVGMPSSDPAASVLAVRGINFETAGQVPVWFNADFQEPRRFYCSVDMAELGQSVGGSMLFPYKNLRYHLPEEIPFCDFDRYLCPNESYCSGSSDLREGCSFHGLCGYDSSERLPLCDCDPGYAGGACSQSDCDVLGLSGVGFRGTCYVRVAENAVSWVAARDVCKSFHSAMDLPVVSDAQVNEFLQFEFVDVSGTMWIGLNDIVTELQYAWIDGSDTSGFSNWETGPTSSTRDCVEMMENGKWNMESCTSSNRFVCALDPSDVNATAAGSGNLVKNVRFDVSSSRSFCDLDSVGCPAEYWCSGNVNRSAGCSHHGECHFDVPSKLPFCDCGDGYVKADCRHRVCSLAGETGIEFQDVCSVKLDVLDMTWMAARRACKAWHSAADLPVVLNVEMNDFLYEEFSEVEVLWLGLHDIISEGNFIWIDGSPLSYSHWAGAHQDSTYDCAKMNIDTYWNPNRWDDTHCLAYETVVCVVDRADYSATMTGSSNPKKNVMFSDWLSDSYSMYCDFGSYVCPPEFWCNRTNCSNHGDCYFDDEKNSPACGCDAGFAGATCSYSSCTLNGNIGIEFNNSCWVRLSEATTWWNARQECKSWHSAADLPMILDADMHAFFSDEFEIVSSMWLGAHDMTSNGNFKWINGRSLDYSPGWTPVYESARDCVFQTPDGIWDNDGFCWYNREFICVVDVPDYVSVNGSLTFMKNVRYYFGGIGSCDIDLFYCPEDYWCGGIANRTAGCSNRGECHYDAGTRSSFCRCDEDYTMSDCSLHQCHLNGETGLDFHDSCWVWPPSDTTTWRLGRDQCKSWHTAADLPVITDIETNDFVLIHFLGPHLLWLGASDFAIEGDFRWTDGSEMSFQFGIWEEYEGFDCLKMLSSGFWSSSNCGDSLRPLCVVDAVDYGALAGSVNAFKNVRYDVTGRAYCDIDSYACPDEFWCLGTHDLTAGCNERGACHFDPDLKRSRCECTDDAGFSGDYCEIDPCGGCVHGTCLPSLKCVCMHRWEGVLCDSPIYENGTDRAKGWGSGEIGAVVGSVLGVSILVVVTIVICLAVILCVVCRPRSAVADMELEEKGFQKIQTPTKSADEAGITPGGPPGEGGASLDDMLASLPVGGSLRVGDIEYTVEEVEDHGV